MGSEQSDARSRIAVGTSRIFDLFRNATNYVAFGLVVTPFPTS